MLDCFVVSCYSFIGICLRIIFRGFGLGCSCCHFVVSRGFRLIACCLVNFCLFVILSAFVCCKCLVCRFLRCFRCLLVLFRLRLMHYQQLQFTKYPIFSIQQHGLYLPNSASRYFFQWCTPPAQFVAQAY